VLYFLKNFYCIPIMKYLVIAIVCMVNVIDSQVPEFSEIFVLKGNHFQDDFNAVD